MIVKDGRRDNIQEKLEDNNRRVQLESKEQIFKPTWEKDTGEYFQRVQRYSSSITNKYER